MWIFSLFAAPPSGPHFSHSWCGNARGPSQCLGVFSRVTPPSQESTWRANRSAATASAAEKAVAAAVAANQSLCSRTNPYAGNLKAPDKTLAWSQHET